jgi:hypothetical protein
MTQSMLRCLILLIVSGIPLSAVHAPEMDVPMAVQFHLFLKMATFDRNLVSRVGDHVVIAVLYQSRYRPSLDAKDEFLKVMSESPVTLIEGIPLSGVSVDLHETADLEQLLRDSEADAVYIAPLRAFEVDRITEVTRKLHIMSLSGITLYVEQGVSAGVGIRGERPEIVINLAGARAEGVDFSSRLLNLARTISNGR